MEVTGGTPAVNHDTSHDGIQDSGQHNSSSGDSSPLCPCQQHQDSPSTMDTIYNALSEEEKFHKITRWISGESPLCSEGINCNVRRVTASFSIINGIRAACRPHLESANKGDNNKLSPSKFSPSKPPLESYDESFPSLQSKPASHPSSIKNNSSSAAPPKTNTLNPRKKPKKRIRPVASVTPANGSTGVWGNIANMPSQKPHEIRQQGEHDTTSTQKSGSLSTINLGPAPARGAWGKATNIPTTNSSLSSEDLLEQRLKSNTIQINKSLLSNNKKGDVDSSQGAREAAGHPASLPVRPETKVPVSAPSKTIAVSNKSGSGTSLSSQENFAANNNLQTPDAKVRNAAGPTISQSPLQSTVTVRNLPVIPATKTQVDRFVEIYCKLILHNLVPSTILEFHLLLRLVNIVDDAKERPENEKDQTTASPQVGNNYLVLPLAPIFDKGTSCRSFAVKALSKLSQVLKQLGMSFLKDLVKSAAFRHQLPDLTTELEEEVKKHTASGGLLLAAEQPSIVSGGTQTALLNLPFQQERDSRHHYRTRDELALYKNREESRDAFLYQLRSFLNVRGKLLDALQAQKSIQRIRSSSRVVLDDVMNINMPGFAQFLCELLLQVGLVPLEETDKDLLNIASKDKLQVGFECCRAYCRWFLGFSSLTFQTAPPSPETAQTIFLESWRNSIEQE